MNTSTTSPYRIERGGFRFELPRTEIARLKTLPDFETEEEPAIADEFLRFRADRWAENLSDAGAAPGPVLIRIDTHQKKTELRRGDDLLFSADI
ncbi:MAG TPA: hypothetical protein VMQ61_09275 [Thermoanaerobaculia bacterium]|nr:hypothetical protein [Thermoanaerobaculia bacterium]